MAIKLGAGHARKGRRRSFTAMSDINVTPMVDVMLVLLVIFMVTAPLLTAGIPVDLPKTSAQEINDPEEPLVVSVDKQGKVFLQETEIALDQLGARIAAVTNNKPDTKIFIRGDKGIEYGRVIEVMGTLTSAGFTQVSLIVETPEVAVPK